MVMRILIGLLSVSAVCGAGMTTHTMAGYRAINYFGKIMHSPNASLYNDALDSNVEAVLAGSDFPDFLYACGKYQVTAIQHARRAMNQSHKALSLSQLCQPDDERNREWQRDVEDNVIMTD